MRGVRGIGKVIGVDLNASKARRIEFDEMPSGWAMRLDRRRQRKSHRSRLPSLPALLIHAHALQVLAEQRPAPRDPP